MTREKKHRGNGKGFDPATPQKNRKKNTLEDEWRLRTHSGEREKKKEAARLRSPMSSEDVPGVLLVKFKKGVHGSRLILEKGNEVEGKLKTREMVLDDLRYAVGELRKGI